MSPDAETFAGLFTAIVRPHLEHVNQVLHPQLRKNTDAIKNVQRRATKLVPELKKFHYEERLGRLKLCMLAYRRSQGDMIETVTLLPTSMIRQARREFSS